MKRLIFFLALILIILPNVYGQEKERLTEFSTSHIYVLDFNAATISDGPKKISWRINFESRKIESTDGEKSLDIYIKKMETVKNNEDEFAMVITPKYKKDMLVRLTIYKNLPEDDIKVTIRKNQTETGAWTHNTFMTTYQVDDWTKLVD